MPTPRPKGLSHPETFIRSRAIKLWADRDLEATGRCRDARRLARPEQPRSSGAEESGRTDPPACWMFYLSSRWFQTDLVLAHARLFLRRLRPSRKTTVKDRTLAEGPATTTGRCRNTMVISCWTS